MTLKSEELSSKTDSMGISEIDLEIELRKAQIKELEKLKKTILTKNKNDKKLKIGVALSGGGAKGFAHIGVLRALEENNIPIDYISGTSMGAIVAGLYAVGYTVDEIEIIVKTMDWRYRLSNDAIRSDVPLGERAKEEKYFVSLTYDDQFNFSFPKGILTGEKSYLKLKELFWNAKDIESFDDLSPKLRIVATDFSTGKAKTFDNGDLAIAISASMAIPTIYQPVEIDNKLYIDGMVSRNLPVEDLYEAGADIVIASDVGAPQYDKNSYNLITVAEKISTYRGTESTEKQRELATIIIDPDVKLESASNFNNFNNLISQGKVATEEKLDELNKYRDDDLKIRKRKNQNQQEIFIDDIQIVDSKILTKNMVEVNLEKSIPGDFSYEDLEDLMMKLYALPQIEKSYYTIEDSTLKINVEENDLHNVRLGLNYNSDLGAKFALGTDFKKMGDYNMITSLELEIGEYKNIEFNNFIYYGEKNKIGINFNIGYEETPLYVYDGRDLKAKTTDKNIFGDIRLTTQLFRQVDFSMGAKYTYRKNKFNVGSDKYKEELKKEYDYPEIYFKLSLDRKNDSIYPTNGNYFEIRHNTGGLSIEDVEYYSQFGVLEGYISATPKLSFNSSISAGMISGGNVPLGDNFKIGGINNDLKNKYISFYGYNTMRKLASEFMIGQIGLQYMLYPNLYILAKANILTYSDISDFKSINGNNSKMFEDFKYGYGLTLGYKSFLGPLEISLTNDADNHGEGILSINMGYIF